MGISLQPSHLLRYKNIAWLLFKYARVDLSKTSGVKEIADEQHPLDEPVDRQAKNLAEDLEKMGPTFIKIGQMLSTRPDLLPLEYIDALTRLQDKVEPFPFEQVEQIVCKELGIRFSRAFSHFDPIPIAAASLGQVHRAAMRDGRNVAVKVQRPQIQDRMVEDLDSLQEVAEMLDHHTDMGKRYEFERIVDEFRKALLRELDYRLEAQNLKTLGTNLKEFNRLVVPQPIDDYTSSRVLTMEYIRGHKITALSPVVTAELDGAVLAEQLFQAYLKQILVDGFFHADPHPGNILLTEDSRIALLDLGMVARVPPSLQDGLLKIILAISEGRSDDVAAGMIAISEKRAGFDEAALRRKVADLVAQNKEVALNRIAVGRVVMEISKMAADCGVRSPREFATLGKTLLNLDQLGAILDPEFNPTESIRRNATSVTQRRMASSLTPGNLYGTLLETKDFIHHLPARVNKLLDAVVNNEIELKVNAIDESKLMRGFQKVANRITMGLILAALIIGAALLMRVDTTLRIFGYPALAMIFFLLAAAGGLLLMLRIVFYDERS
jgi:predicted unusual protein kinase regulating ubiquinone biosynthesis (AarF/ABC1/UbiB family)